MINIEILRKNFEHAKKNLFARGFELDDSQWNALEIKRKDLQVKTESLQEQLNKMASNIGEMQKNGEDISIIKKEAGELSASLKISKSELDMLQQKINDFLLSIPNLLNENVPIGKSEEDNIVVKESGKIPSFSFKIKDHQELGIDIGGMDFEAAAKIAKSRFVIFKDTTAKLNRALIQFMLDIHTKEHGYKEIYVPLIVNSESLVGTGQLPKFKEDQFKVDDSDQDLYLVPTAEVPVTNYHRGEIISAEELPISYVCHSPCFRSEAGSYGQDTKGIIRQHQFEKVELVRIVPPGDSHDELEKLTNHAEKILELLNLPYRKIILCSKDTGFASSFTYDLEVWFPSQNKYREISSCSNFEDFQSRRMQIRTKENNKNVLCHTLNGSGLAIGRTMAAIFENYQNEDGSISIPEVLRPYMDNKKTL